MKRYNNFINEKIGRSKKSQLDMIITYLEKNTKYTFVEYEEEFIVEKFDYKSKFNSILFLMIDTKSEINERRAIRFNFTNFNIFSIDMWEDFIFNLDMSEKIYNKPSYEMKISFSKLKQEQILSFVNGDFLESIKESIDDINESPDENVESQIYKLDDYDLDPFEAIKYNVLQVAFNEKTTSFILSGLSGMGKSYNVTNTLKEVHKPYRYFKGNTTAAGLYELLFLYRKELIVLDDMDDALVSKDTRDMLKAVLDTNEERELSRRVKGYFESVGWSDEEIEEEFKKSGKLPNSFVFTGSIIFITNLKEDEIDPVIFTRTLHIDISLEHEEIIERLKTILPFMHPNVSVKSKEETLEVMIDLLNTYVEKAPLNLRTLYHCINFKVSNDALTKKVKDEDVPLWILLVKKFLVRNKKLKDIKKDDN